MDDTTRYCVTALCVFLLGFCLSMLVVNRWPKLGNGYIAVLIKRLRI